MRALTFRQPYASAALSVKPFDNRKTCPPRDLVGRRIAIHAGAAFDKDDEWGLHEKLRYFGMVLDGLPVGGFVGTALLRGYVLFDDDDAVALFDPEEKARCGLTESEIYDVIGSTWRLARARVVLVLSDPRFLPALIPSPGALGFWKVPEQNLAALEACR